MKRNKHNPHNYSSLYIYFFILTIINILYFSNTVNAKSLLKTNTNKSTSDKDNPFAGMSDAELDKMMKEYGLDSKDLGISKKSSSSNSSSSGKIKNSSLDMSLDEDPLAMLEISNSNSHKSQEFSSPKKIKEIYAKNKEILKKFELSEKDAYSLITQVSKFQIFNKLPLTAMNIIKESKSQKSYQKISKKDTLSKNDETNTNMLISNTLNSQVFIDHENKVGRKGMLSLVNKDTAEVKNVWAVLNSRVFCLYKSSNYLNILKIYRISMLKIKDFIYSPCFFVYYGENDSDGQVESDKNLRNLRNLNLNKNKIKNDSESEKDMKSLSSLSRNRNNQKNENSPRSLIFTNFKNSQSLICALNFREKDYWLKLIKYHKEQYKN
jgi:hypothetical protein